MIFLRFAIGIDLSVFACRRLVSFATLSLNSCAGSASAPLPADAQNRTPRDRACCREGTCGPASDLDAEQPPIVGLRIGVVAAADTFST